ncbi:hypothetical protein E2C01_079796 [Portunus trituberculatus]|uniref:Uncharacterized protein n=1 Tax=Portunus trituberculatus TaxID=210409 RepID=A0A5B7IWK5_PORTR|nr:hypothetical protein [Portunus trituberculatus]
MTMPDKDAHKPPVALRMQEPLVTYVYCTSRFSPGSWYKACWYKAAAQGGKAKYPALVPQQNPYSEATLQAALRFVPRRCSLRATMGDNEGDVTDGLDVGGPGVTEVRVVAVLRLRDQGTYPAALRYAGL